MKFDDILQSYKPHAQSYEGEFINVLKVFLMKPPTISEVFFFFLALWLSTSKTNTYKQAQLTKDFTAFAMSRKEAISKCGIRRITLSIDSDQKIPRHFTFRNRLNFAEDPIYRDIEPPLAYHLGNYQLYLLKTVDQLTSDLMSHHRAQEIIPKL